MLDSLRGLDLLTLGSDITSPAMMVDASHAGPGHSASPYAKKTTPPAAPKTLALSDSTPLSCRWSTWSPPRPVLVVEEPELAVELRPGELVEAAVVPMDAVWSPRVARKPLDGESPTVPSAPGMCGRGYHEHRRP